VANLFQDLAQGVAVDWGFSANAQPLVVGWHHWKINSVTYNQALLYFILPQNCYLTDAF
jgi:hypothetical protein